jgi:hypothetical protein
MVLWEADSYQLTAFSRKRVHYWFSFSHLQGVRMGKNFYHQGTKAPRRHFLKKSKSGAEMVLGEVDTRQHTVEPLIGAEMVRAGVEPNYNALSDLEICI